MIGVLLTQPDLPASTPAVVPCPPTTVAPPPAALDALGFLVGGVWLALLPTGQRLEETCEWGLDNQFILAQASRTLQTKVISAARGVFGWSGQGTTLLSWSFVTQGCYVTGQQTAGAAGSFVFLTTTGGAATAQGRSTITPTGADAMTLTAEVLQGGVYVVSTVARYTRT